MTPKYLVFGGYVTSKNDGDEHYIMAEKLVRLYDVNPMECKLVNSVGKNDVHASIQRESLMKCYPDAIVLRPDYSGEYIIKRNPIYLAKKKAVDNQV